MFQNKKMAVMSFLLCIGMSTPVLALDDINDKPSVGAILGDLLFARPILFATTQLGSLFYTLSLPLTLLNGDSEGVAETLVVAPAQATYTRCLGCVGSNAKSKVVSSQHFIMVEGNYNTFDYSNAGNKAGSSIGWAANMGTNFKLTDNSRFDVYLGYKDFGEPADLDKVITGSPLDYSLTSYSIINRAGTNLFKSDVYVMVKAGFHKWEEEIKVAGVKAKDEGVDFVYGLGLDYQVSESYRFGLGYSKYGLGERSIASYDATFTSFF
jgi:opacity protein-like surface antigen